MEARERDEASRHRLVGKCALEWPMGTPRLDQQMRWRSVELDPNDPLDVENEQWVRIGRSVGEPRALRRIGDLSCPAGHPSVSPPRQLLTFREDGHRMELHSLVATEVVALPGSRHHPEAHIAGRGT